MKLIPYVLDNGDIVNARFDAMTGAAVIDFLIAFVAEHPSRQMGECPKCGHYGQDCHGNRAANLLADLRGIERPIEVVE